MIHQLLHFNPRNLFRKNILAPFLAINGMLVYDFLYKKRFECCGILGIITTKANAELYIIDGIEIL